MRRLLSLSLSIALVAACSASDDDSSTGSTSNGNAGTSAAGSSAAGMAAAGASAGGNASAGMAAAGMAAAGMSAGGMSAGGNAAGGMAMAGMSAAGMSSGGMGTGGAVGVKCCTDDAWCKDPGKRCIAGDCVDRQPSGQCYYDSDCAGGTCVGATFCGCSETGPVECFAGTSPGQCEGGAGGAAGAPQAWDQCGVPGDCILQAKGCCGGCGAPDPAMLDGVNREKTSEHYAAVCTDPNPTCPGCASMESAEVIAACALGPGKCMVIDVPNSYLADCTQDSDCTLRGPGCCEYCGDLPAQVLVALNKSMMQAYGEQVCPPGPSSPCPPCVPTYPSDVTAVCDQATKRCVKAMVGPL